ncbi:EAL domain-containing protein [Pseudomonas aeruginosa]|nr:EAL domain-containing protein [Escherichia coli]MBK4366254.1 EAL domain-containing protein [Enterobacter hormaechei]PIA06052.1 hypothetical protein CS906_05260 [Enterobacter cloacae]MBK4594821.1 EAL domain-containing protein [Enterobacter hormaechei]MBK4671942.1 EAL domain-containing protein [Enterobacter hormaechei]
MMLASCVSCAEVGAVDAIKLDRAFVAGLPEDRHDLAIVHAVAALARTLGIEVVAEGVEHERQCACLRECGIDGAQGYLFAPALEAETLRARLAAG